MFFSCRLILFRYGIGEQESASKHAMVIQMLSGEREFVSVLNRIEIWSCGITMGKNFLLLHLQIEPWVFGTSMKKSQISHCSYYKDTQGTAYLDIFKYLPAIDMSWAFKYVAIKQLVDPPILLLGYGTWNRGFVPMYWRDIRDRFTAYK